MPTINNEVKKIEGNSLFITAAEYTYNNFFSKPYKLAPHERYPSKGDYNGYVIQRPNHSLSHSIRKMLYLPPVIKAHKVKHPDGNMDLELEYMQLASLFSVVGRESEVSFKDDNKSYVAFKKASAEAFITFVLTYQQQFSALQKLIQSKKLNFYKSLIDNPQGDDAIRKVFIIAHNLDLMRCYTEGEFKNTRKVIISLLGFKENEPQGEKLADSLISYTKSCLAATGDMNLSIKKDRIPELFIKSNINVKYCLSALAGVKEPVIDISMLGNQHKNIEKQKLFNNKNDDKIKIVPVIQNPIVKGPSNPMLFKPAKSYYQRGLVHEQNQKYDEAYKYFYADAQKGNANSQYKVGLYRYKGLVGGKIDMEGAMKYFTLSAKQGNKDAISAITSLQQIQKQNLLYKK